MVCSTKRLGWQRQPRWARLERERQQPRQRQSLERRQSPSRPKQVLLSPALIRGSFLFKICLPTNEHFARLNEKPRYTEMLIVRNGIAFPSDQQKEFGYIESLD